MSSKKRYHSENSRRTKAMEQGGMIGMDISGFANMPQQSISKPWPVADYYMPDDSYNDTISGMDDQMRKDYTQTKKHLAPKKY